MLRYKGLGKDCLSNRPPGAFIVNGMLRKSFFCLGFLFLIAPDVLAKEHVGVVASYQSPPVTGSDPYSVEFKGEPIPGTVDFKRCPNVPVFGAMTQRVLDFVKQAYPGHRISAYPCEVLKNRADTISVPDYASKSKASFGLARPAKRTKALQVRYEVVLEPPAEPRVPKNGTDSLNKNSSAAPLR